VTRFDSARLEEVSKIFDDEATPEIRRFKAEMDEIMNRFSAAMTKAYSDYQRAFFRLTGNKTDWQVVVYHPDLGGRLICSPDQIQVDAPGTGGRRERSKPLKAGKKG
jgi:hypothetical protein